MLWVCMKRSNAPKVPHVNKCKAGAHAGSLAPAAPVVTQARYHASHVLKAFPKITDLVAFDDAL